MTTRDRTLLKTLFALLLLCLASDRGVFTGKVTSVSDGDTITVLRNGRPVTIRIFGIDAPEPNQPNGERAHRLAEALAFGETVKVTFVDKDHYGRIVGKVQFSDGRSLAAEMLRAGLAWWYFKYAPDETELKKLEETARVARVGLWADENPVPPWEYRKWPWCASKNSKIYHPCSCPSVRGSANETNEVINYRNLIRFKTEQDAIDSGRRHCKCSNSKKTRQ